MAFLLIIAIVALFIVYRVIYTQLQERRFRAFAQQNGCADVLDITKSRFAAFARLKRILKSRKSGEDIIDDILVPDFDDAKTFANTQFTGSTIVATAEPANIQALLATQFEDYATGERRYQAVAPVLGRSIFSCDGAFWKHSRELFRPQFSRENINDLDATNYAARTLFEAVEIDLDKESGWTSEVDMLPLFYNLTLDTATDFLFGESVGAQKAGIHKAMSAAGQHSSDTAASSDMAQQASSNQFGKDFETLGAVLQRRIQLQALYWLGDGRKFRRAIANSHAFIERLVQDAIDGLDTEKKNKKDYLLSALVTQTQDRVELRNQALAILFAGRDTTAALLAWCTVRLALHSEVFAELRRAILAHFGDTGDAGITFSALKSCRPLQHFINEVLRLNSIVPFNARVAVRDTTLPVGGGANQRSPIAIRKGTNILYSVYVMHRRKDLWGEDALDFKPSRWEERRASTAWQFLPFNGGPRICLGQQFAIVETSYVLVRLLQRYQAVEAVDREQMAEMKKGIGLAMWPADGARVRWLRSEA